MHLAQAEQEEPVFADLNQRRVDGGPECVRRRVFQQVTGVDAGDRLSVLVREGGVAECDNGWLGGRQAKLPPQLDEVTGT
jgi:hypothetical protein